MIPRWMAALFAVIMLCVCGAAAFCTVSRVDLTFQLADRALMLDTSRQRERKQQYEYDQVTAELPEVRAQAAAAEPLAEDAKALEKDLRAQRKQLRAEEKQLSDEKAGTQVRLEQTYGEAEKAAVVLRTEIDRAMALIAPLIATPGDLCINE